MQCDGDRVDHVRVLDLVEQALDQARGVEAEVAADQLGCSAEPPAASRTPERSSSPGVAIEPAGDHDRSGVDRVALTVAVQSTRRRSPSGRSPPVVDQDPADVAAGPQLELPVAHGGWM